MFCAGVKSGMMRRQCTREYKIEVIERAIRYELIGLKPRKHIPRDVHVYQYLGISTDESDRAVRTKANYGKRSKWATPVFPLIERGWSRQDCLQWLAGRVPHVVPKSACVFCPYRTNDGWEYIKLTDPEGWARAVQIDNALRTEGTRANLNLHKKLYLHRSCIPLELVNLEVRDDKQGPGLNAECEGMCGL